jgi:hypothetical protein
VVLQWTAPRSGRFSFLTAGTSFNTVLYALDGCTNPRALACQDDVEPAQGLVWSRIDQQVTAGQVLFLVVDGHDQNASGDFGLTITEEGETPGECSSGQQRACYSGSAGTEGVGRCRAGTQVCEGAGRWPSVCAGEVTPASTETCGDGVDDNCNGMTDEGCTSGGGCPENDLGSAVRDRAATGSTVGRSNNLTPAMCATGSTAPETTFRWTAPSSGMFTFTTEGSDYDTVLYARRGSCTSTDIACNDDTVGTTSSVTLAMGAGEAVILVVDGYEGNAGNFVLNIRRSGGCVPNCAGRVCGDDGCGGTCLPGTCPSGQTCGSDGRCAGPTAPPRWTIFVYGHGDHNLSPSLVTDLAEMSDASLGANVNVIVMADWDASARVDRYTDVLAIWNRIIPAAARSAGANYPVGTQWFRVIGGGRPLEHLRTAAEQNLDDPSVLAEAIRVAFTTYPADRYGIILWDHGGSWQGGFGSDYGNTRFLEEGLRRSAGGMPAQSVASAIRSGVALAGLRGVRPLQFIAFDTCLMGTVEVAYPFRDLAQVFLAEAEVDFGDGWDYRATFTQLALNPSMTAQEFARIEMANWASHHRTATPQDMLIRSKIALDLASMDALANATRSFTTALLADPMMSTPQVARAAVRTLPAYHPQLTQNAQSSSYRDLGQFLDNIRALPIGPALRIAATTLDAALSSTIVTSDQGTRRALARQRALQVTLPEWIQFTDGLEGRYRTAASEWSIATRWSELIATMAPSGRTPARAATREARATCRPRTMPSRGAPWATSEITSLSAKTVQVDETATGRSARADSSRTSSNGTCSRPRITSRKRPVPAAHLSFMAKSSTSPAPPRRITLVSCPPTSRSTPGRGRRRKAPRAWQVISVRLRSARTRLRP